MSSNAKDGHGLNGDLVPVGSSSEMQNHNTGGVSREQHALQDLMREISFVGGPSSFSISADSVASVEAFLMRNLIASDFSITQAVTQLRQRRTFERRLPSLRVTPPVLAALRSGWISLIGRDVEGRSVLFLNAQQFSLSPLDSGDAQRVLIMVMEYMLAHAALVQPQASASSGRNPSPLQQFTVLVAEKGTSWNASQSLLAHMSTIPTVISKYYPRLVGLILLMDASPDVRRGVKEYIADKTESVKKVFKLITRADIANYMDPELLPAEIRDKSVDTEGTAMFADAVLRHWYVMTSYLLVEDAAGRPLWQLPPVIATATDWSSFQRYRSPAPSTGKGLQSHPMVQQRSIGVVGDATSLASSRRSCAFFTCNNYDDDDGLCSTITETDCRAYTDSSPKVSPQDVHVDFSQPNEKLALELQREHELRKLAEVQLKKMRLGITLDLSTATDLERALAVMHSELNNLVANIIVRANEASLAKSPPTLSQLLDLTLSALEAATRRAERVPAMKFAVPFESPTENTSFCCSVM